MLVLPPYECYSNARRMGRGGNPATREKDMLKADALVHKTLQILEYSDAEQVIEPRNFPALAPTHDAGHGGWPG